MPKKMEMYNPRGGTDQVFDAFKTTEFLGEGIEGKVHRIKLLRLEHPTELKGFVRKEFHLDDEQYRENVEEGFLKAVENWEAILDVNKKRKKAGQETFLTPGTVRPYMDEQGGFGFIMTDLSQDGARQVFSLDDLHRHLFRNPQLLTSEQWEHVKTAVEKDLRIAVEEQIKLRAGDLGLDPWMVTIDPDGSVQVWLADVGRFVQVGADQNVVDTSIAQQREGLKRLDDLVQGHRTARTFWEDR